MMISIVFENLNQWDLKICVEIDLKNCSWKSSHHYLLKIYSEMIFISWNFHFIIFVNVTCCMPCCFSKHLSIVPRNWWIISIPIKKQQAKFLICKKGQMFLGKGCPRSGRGLKEIFKVPCLSCPLNIYAFLCFLEALNILISSIL